MFQKPERLNKGDKVGIIVPSSPIRVNFRKKGLARLKGLGYLPIEVQDIRKRNGFLAKPAEENFRDIQMFFNEADVRAIWAARGGYGSNYLLALLGNLQIKKPKIVIGSSDVSYVLWYLLDRFRMVVFYGPMLYSAMAENRVNTEQLLSLLGGHSQTMGIGGTVWKPGRSQGIITGGCLSNLISLIGTPYFPEIRQRILFLEDTHERPYRLDRMMWQLFQNGIFAQIKGLALGEFTDCFKDEEEKNYFFSRLDYYLKGLDIPVICDLPLGHSQNIHTLPLGISVEMDTSEFEGIMIKEKAVL